MKTSTCSKINNVTCIIQFLLSGEAAEALQSKLWAGSQSREAAGEAARGQDEDDGRQREAATAQERPPGNCDQQVTTRSLLVSLIQNAIISIHSY